MSVPTDRLSALAGRILAETGRPKDQWEVAAALEVAGVRDIDAQQEHGCADVFALARQIMATYDVAPTEPAPAPARAIVVWRFLRAYLTGLLFSMPMTAQ